MHGFGILHIFHHRVFLDGTSVVNIPQEFGEPVFVAHTVATSFVFTHLYIYTQASAQRLVVYHPSRSGPGVRVTAEAP